MSVWKITTCFALLATTLLCVAPANAQTDPDEGQGPPPLDTSVNTLEDYHAQADTTLPPFGTTLLAVPNGPDWVGTLLLGRLAVAMDDVAPSSVATNGALQIGTDTAERTIMKIDTERGRVRYINLDRQFDWDFSSHQAVPESLALGQILQAMSTLNVPAAEYLDATGACLCSVSTVRGEDYETTDSSGVPFSAHEAERMVTARRQINGVPVFDSMLRASVANDGQIARLLARWPQFRLPTGLVMRSRAAVLDDIAAGIWSREMGAALDDLSIQVGYLQVGAFHLPVAEVTLLDRDSGAGFHVPLVGMAADIDLDGMADAVDNCPELHNAPHQVPLDCNGDGDTLDPGEAVGAQCDRDNDGVGDGCDNCPDAPNATQADADADGTGDACQEPEGACCGVGDGGSDCERMTASLCVATGGTYVGNGTDCLGDNNGDGADDACGCACSGAADCVDLNGDAAIDDTCTFGECVGAPCGACVVVEKVVPADISGAFGACRPDGFCNVHDRNQALACFSGSTPCETINIDAGGAFGNCAADGFCNIHDANHALTCFAGTSTCGCGAMPELDSVVEAGRVDLQLAAKRQVEAGETFAVTVRLIGTVELQSYQLHADVTGGQRGTLELVDIVIDDTKAPALGAGRFEARNLATAQVLSGLDSGGVKVDGKAYLATFVYRASPDALGSFVIDVRHGAADDQTFLISNFTDRIAIKGTSPAIVTIGRATRRD